MISSTLGAPLGGTTRAGQYGFESFASRLISPWKPGAGLGRYRPSMVVVALGEPGVPVISCAAVGPAWQRNAPRRTTVDHVKYWIRIDELRYRLRLSRVERITGCFLKSSPAFRMRHATVWRLPPPSA